MKTYKKVTVKVDQLESITCDVCDKIFLVEKDSLEIQEFYNITILAGYNSVFGDESEVVCNICQHCLYNLISKFCWINGVKGITNEKSSH